MGEGRSDKNVDFAFQMTGDRVDRSDKNEVCFQMTAEVKVSIL